MRTGLVLGSWEGGSQCTQNFPALRFSLYKTFKIGIAFATHGQNRVWYINTGNELTTLLSHWDKPFLIGRRKKSDEGKHVFQHLLRIIFYYSNANSSLALIHTMESEIAFYKKIAMHIYAYICIYIYAYICIYIYAYICPLSFIWHIGKHCCYFVGHYIPVSVGTYFWRIWAENEVDCPQITYCPYFPIKSAKNMSSRWLE